MLKKPVRGKRYVFGKKTKKKQIKKIRKSFVVERNTARAKRERLHKGLGVIWRLLKCSAA